MANNYKRGQNMILKWKLLVDFLYQNTLSRNYHLFTPQTYNCNKTNFVTFNFFLHQEIFFYKDEIRR